jgi:hypothetical protein
LEQVSFTVQALRSLQAVPFGFPVQEHAGDRVCTQLPVVELQVSIEHASLSSQFLVVPVQALFEHTSFRVQALLSLQGRVLA